MELEVIGDCLVLDHTTQGGQIANSDLRESAGLESGLVNQEVCPWYQLEGSCLESVGSVVLAGSEPPGVHDTQTEWQQKTLGGGGGEREVGGGEREVGEGEGGRRGGGGGGEREVGGGGGEREGGEREGRGRGEGGRVCVTCTHPHTH